MPQTALTPITLKQDNYSVVAGDLTVTFTPSDTVNGNSFPATGNEVLLIWNTDGAAAHTFTVTSVADSLGRSDTSLTNYSVPLNTIAAIQMSTLGGWIQTNGNVNLTSSNALLKFAVLKKN
jgi:hypothetical protein